MKVAFYTLGCKVNQYETNAMMDIFKNAGYDIVDFTEFADIYIVNTCTVTSMSDKKSRQILRRAKQINKNSVLCAVGCYAQVAKEELLKIEEIDIILGTVEKKNILQVVEEYLAKNKKEALEKNIVNEENAANTENAEIAENHGKTGKTEKVDALTKIKSIKEKVTKVDNVMKKMQYENYDGIAYTEHARAEIKIQDGCDRFCSYCIIPYARGPVRSRNMGDIIKEIKNVVASGVKEVVITGIHISSYGKDFKGNVEKDISNSANVGNKSSNDCNEDAENKFSSSRNEDVDNKKSYKIGLIDLLEEINKIDGLHRIRLGSLEPTIITEEFVAKLVKLDKVCNHFHLSLQSGCDETLKRMNRKYNTNEFRNIVNLLRKNIPEVALTTDVIVGFPGETDEEFEITRQFLEEINFSKMHIFKYSKRKGTPAATFKDQISDIKKEERSNILLEMSNKNEEKFASQYIGREIEVLFENETEGHTTNYISVIRNTNSEKSKADDLKESIEKRDAILSESAEKRDTILKESAKKKDAILNESVEIKKVVPKEWKNGALYV